MAKLNHIHKEGWRTIQGTRYSSCENLEIKVAGTHGKKKGWQSSEERFERKARKNDISRKNKIAIESPICLEDLREINVDLEVAHQRD